MPKTSRIPGDGQLRVGAIAQLQLQREAKEQAHSGATETISMPRALERDTLHHWLNLGMVWAQLLFFHRPCWGPMITTIIVIVEWANTS